MSPCWKPLEPGAQETTLLSTLSEGGLLWLPAVGKLSSGHRSCPHTCLPPARVNISLIMAAHSSMASTFSRSGSEVHMLSPEMDRSSISLNLFFCLRPNLGDTNAPSNKALARKWALTKLNWTSSHVASQSCWSNSESPLLFTAANVLLVKEGIVSLKASGWIAGISSLGAETPDSGSQPFSGKLVIISSTTLASSYCWCKQTLK